MNTTGIRRSIALALLAALLVAIILTSGAHSSPDGDSPAPAKASRLQQVKLSMAKLLDFKFYQKIYHKSYSSVVELMVRSKCYMARAMSVFVAALNYVNRKQGHYLSVNHMSDETVGERSMRRNQVLDAEFADDKSDQFRPAETSHQAASLWDSIADLGEHPIETLVELLEARKSDPYFAQMLEALEAMQQDSSRPSEAHEIVQHLMKPRRQKRSTDAVEVERRHLPVGMLMNLDPNDGLEQTQPKPRPKLMGDRADPFMSFVYNAKRGVTEKLSLEETLDEIRQRQMQHTLRTTSLRVPDEIFIDHRDTNCFFIPRAQGRCGSCYAFAAVALMEYYYCRKTGHLTAFSEQYVVDCGKQYYPDRIMGCQGGFDESVVGFFNDLGLESRQLYPYRQRVEVCPYDAHYERERAGAIRVDVKFSWRVYSNDFEEVLKRSPIMIIVKTPSDFQEYGGGVHSCEDMHNSQGAHSMLLIGHGIEDNQEYWLMRNSFSAGWGEGGHFKLSKKADCLLNYGHIFGSSDSKSFDMVVVPNVRYEPHPVQMKYLIDTFKEQNQS